MTNVEKSIEIRNHSNQPIYIEVFQSKISGRFYVEVFLKPQTYTEEVKSGDYIQPNIWETM